MVVLEESIDVTFPIGTVRMLLVQPCLQLATPAQEPFPLSAACADRLLLAIDTALSDARTTHSQVIVFPEFSVPATNGVERILAHLSDPEIPGGTVVIAGLSGMTRAVYEALLGLPYFVSPDGPNALAAVLPSEWVNSSVTFVKDNNDVIRAWVQPKACPSWAETNTHYQSMFKGGVMRIFRGRFANGIPCRFVSLLCFEWVGRKDAHSFSEEFLQHFNDACQAIGNEQALQWVFVLQHNGQPNHPSFLTATQHFLTQNDHPFVRRQDTAVIMACTASSMPPARGGPYGYSSIVFGPRAPFDASGSRPTFATQASRLRQSNILGTCKDALFREMGECIHVADVRVPNFVVPDATDRTAGLVVAQVRPMTGPVVDPRVPAAAVPAVVKWVNDELDSLPTLSTAFSSLAIGPTIGASEDTMVAAHRTLPSQSLASRVDAACASRLLDPQQPSDPSADIDSIWDDLERKGLRHVLQTLTLLNGGSEIDVGAAQLHARSVSRGVEVAAITGSTHPTCLAAFKKLATRTHSPILLVMRDEHNLRHLPREVESFADPRGGAGVRVTDAQTLFESARSMAGDTFCQFVTELLDADDRRII